MDFYDSDLKYKACFLESRIEELFKIKDKVRLSEIRNYLREIKFSYTEEELIWVIYYMFIKRGTIIKNDFWNKEEEYIRIDSYYELSSYTKHYYSFDVDDYNTKKILLISDTHIGNKRLEDFTMIDKVYDYAIKNGATKCFHLGDVFTGDINWNEDFDLKSKHNQIKRFIDNYPRPKKTEMMTYSILGNNDEEIDNLLWHDGYSDYYYDLRQLTYFNPSFYMFPREYISVDFLDKKFHLAHKFHHSMLIHNLRLTCPEDLIKQDMWLDGDYSVRISGHLHTGLIYGAAPSQFSYNEQLFLGVPATIKENKNKAVAYLITLNYKNEHEITDMDISILNCDNNYKIEEVESLKWNFSGQNENIGKIKIL